MARTDFQLTAEIILSGPRGLGQVAQNIKKGFQLDPSVNQQFDKLSGNINKANKSVQSLNNAVGALGKSFKSAQANIKKSNTSIQQTRGSAAQATSAMEDFGRTTGFVTKRLIGFRIASGLVLGFGGAIRSAVGDAIEFERQLVKVAQVTEKDVTQLGRLSKEITRLSVKFGVASKDLVTASKTLSQAGLSARDTRIALEALAKSTLLPTFGEMGQTVEGSIAIFNQFQLEAKDLLGVLSSIDAVTGKLAVEASDVTVAVKKAGGVFAALNRDVDNGVQSFNEFLAIFASVRQTTRESAQNIAVGLRTIFARIQRPRTIQFLKQFNVELEGTGKQAGQLLKPLEIIDKLSEAFGEIGARNLNIGQIVQQLGGTRQVAKVLPLLFQQELRQKALRIATEGQVGADEKLNKALETLSVRIGQVREEFKAFIRDVLVGSTTFNLILGSVLNITQGLIKFASAIKPILPFLAILGGIKAGGAIRQFGKGFLTGIRTNPLAAQGGGVAAGTISTQQTTATGQRSAMHSNTAALAALTTQLQRMSLGGGGKGGFGAVFDRGGGGRKGGGTSFIPIGQLDMSKARKRGFGAKISRGTANARAFAGQHAFGLAAAGAIGGGFAAETIGRKTKGRAGAGGLIAGAGGGALVGGAIGSVVPAVGTAIGAVVGALVGGLGGAISALKDFKKTLAIENIEDSLESLQNTFGRFNKGLLTLDQANIRLLRETEAILKEIEGRSGRLVASGTAAGGTVGRVFNEKDVQEFGADARQKFRQIRDQLTDSFKAEFEAGTAFEDISIDKFKALGFAFGDVDRAIEESGDSVNKLKELIIAEGVAHGQALKKIYDLTQEINKFNFALDFVQDNFRRLNARLKSINANIGQVSLTAAQSALSRAQGHTTLGGTPLGRNIFENIQGVSPTAVSGELSRLGIGGELAKQVNLARVIPDILRSIAGSVANANPLEITQAFQDKLVDVLPDAPKVLDFFLEKIEKMEVKSAEEMFELLAKNLPNQLKLAVDAAKQFQEGVNQANRDFRNAQKQHLQLQLQNITNLAKIRTDEIKLRQSGITARGGQLSLGQRLAPTGVQLRTLGVGTSVQGILRTREGARTAVELGKTTAALQVLAGATDALAEIQKEIASFEQRRLSAQRTAQDIFAQGPKQRLEEIRDLQAFIRFQRGGRLTQRGLRGGQFIQKQLEEQGQAGAAARVGTRLTRAIPGAAGFLGGIGVKAPGRAAPPVLERMHQVLLNQITQAREELLRMRAEALKEFGEKSAQAFQQRSQALFQAIINFDGVTKELANVLNNANMILTLSVPQPIPVVVQGGGVLANDLADAIGKRLSQDIAKGLIGIIPNATNLQ